MNQRLREHWRVSASLAKDAAKMSVTFGDGDDEVMVRLADVLIGGGVGREGKREGLGRRRRMGVI